MTEKPQERSKVVSFFIDFSLGGLSGAVAKTINSSY